MAQHKEITMPMLEIALEMEEEGKVFYEEAITKTDNPLGRQVFGGLLGDELVHIERINAIYSSLEAGREFSDKWTSFRTDHKDLESLLHEVAKEHERVVKADTGDMEALNLGMDFERKSIDFYEDHLRKASDPKEISFIERMVSEEKGHYELLEDMKDYLQDPAAWRKTIEKISKGYK